MKSLRLLPLVFALFIAGARAQNVPIVMLSDIHFDPFHDPAKFPQLLVAPTSGWQAIFDSPDSPTQAADFAGLQKACKAKGVDTPSTLLASSLAAEKQQMPHPLFVTVSGDLMAHKFDCRFKQLNPKGTEADYSAFAAKTVEYVSLALHATFPQSPVYIGLGNNDSGCEDYREDSSSAYLQSDAKAFAADTLSKANSAAVLKDFAAEGDYAVTLPEPFHHTKLLVLQDIFESKRYTGCNGKADAKPEAAQIAWLRAELTAARAHHEMVWVMAHIPPGVDAYSTFNSGKNICAGEPAELFLDSEAFARTITDFPGVIRLVLLGHTHMDEMRVYFSSKGTSAAASIPGKLVPSLSPVNGNSPAFTVGYANPENATLVDYQVFSADNMTGVGTKWTEEYRYSTTYKMPDFSGASAAKLLTAMHADRAGSSPESKAYEQFYFVGDPHVSANAKASALGFVWPAYTCSITQSSEAAFRACSCPAK